MIDALENSRRQADNARLAALQTRAAFRGGSEAFALLLQQRAEEARQKLDECLKAAKADAHGTAE